MSLLLKKIEAIETGEMALPFRRRFLISEGRKTPTTFTAEEYLEFERESEERHEFIDGRIIEMAGESLSHSRLCINLAIEFGSQLRRKNCEALSPNMKVRTTTQSLFAYPDLTIVCGEPRFHDTKKDVLINPTVIFEVLSPSTEYYDRGKKFQFYKKKTPSLIDYILVSQNQILVEQFTKQANESWLYRSFDKSKDILRIGSIECEVSLQDIYLRVEFSQKEDISEN